MLSLQTRSLQAAGRMTRRAGVLALAAATALIMTSGAAPAPADTVRNAEMWVLNAINAPAAWQVTKGQGVTVAVIDSGVDPGVSDLTGSVITGPDLTGVGTPPANPDWGMHGTWMASLIAGHGHDGGDSGIIGIAPLAHVLSIRVITNSGDPGFARYEHQSQARHQRELATAINYAISHGAGVISMSLGDGAPSRPVLQAIQDALNRNIVILASSGNSGNQASARAQGHAPLSFPADYPGVLSVAAVGQNGAPAGFSSDNLSVQVAAPGVQVPAQGQDGGYWLVSGGRDHQHGQQPPGQRLRRQGRLRHRERRGRADRGAAPFRAAPGRPGIAEDGPAQARPGGHAGHQRGQPLRRRARRGSPAARRPAGAATARGVLPPGGGLPDDDRHRGKPARPDAAPAIGGR